MVRFSKYFNFMLRPVSFYYVKFLAILSFIITVYGCKNSNTQKQVEMKKVRLIVLDPGHFHAALVQKTMYAGIDSTVNVFAPDGSDLESYLHLIERYNTRTDHPTSWKLNVNKGADYFKMFLSQKPGSLVILAGNNKNKTEYIKNSVDAGFHVLSDKPMAITTDGFELLKSSFESARKSNVLLYDIMTARFEITNILERELLKSEAVFGVLEKGTAENPAIAKQSTHYFYKTVSGTPLVRPEWYFDTDQEGEGIVDVTTHLVDLVQWECFPEKVLNYENDIKIEAAKRWPTLLTLAEFSAVTKGDSFPAFLAKDIKNKVLNVFSNGEINYTIRGIHTKVSAEWKYQAPEGSADTYFSRMRGTRANLIIRQDKEQRFKPVLYIEPAGKNNNAEYEKMLATEFQKLQEKYPGVGFRKDKTGWQVIIPEKFSMDHEQQFEEVTKSFLMYLQQGKIPEWEVSFMKAKYYTTTEALRTALKK